MKNKFVNIVLQEFLEVYGIDQETKYSYELISMAEKDFEKKLSEKQLEEYQKIEEMKGITNLHEMERLVAFMFHFLQV